MRVLVTGATGFVGRALVQRLQRDGQTVVAWARSPDWARATLGAEVELVDARDGVEALTPAVASCTAVVNLAGEPIAGHRWTERRRALLRDSRVGVTKSLVHAIANAKARPRVLVSGSAVGYYGDRGEERLTEEAGPRRDFLSRLCQDWEAAAHEAEAFDVRVVISRTGFVVGRGGGGLVPMMLPFKLGLGGPVASGRQYLSWIHLHDLVHFISDALTDERFAGPVNAVAPDPVTNREFSRALGRALHRPSRLPVPAFVLRAIFGESANVLLDSQRVDCAVLRRLAFPFRFSAVDTALAEAVG